MSASLALQKALRGRLVATPALTDLVPAASILDRHARPAPDPSIVIGEGQELEGDDIARRKVEIAMDLHVWKKETSLAGVKAIAGAVRKALHADRFEDADGWLIGDCRVTSQRFLRDPDGETSHAVVTVSALLGEVA